MMLMLDRIHQKDALFAGSDCICMTRSIAGKCSECGMGYDSHPAAPAVVYVLCFSLCFYPFLFLFACFFHSREQNKHNKMQVHPHERFFKFSESYEVLVLCRYFTAVHISVRWDHDAEINTVR